MPANASNQSIQRAARVLFAVAGADGGLTVAQIARACDLLPATAYRFIRSLEREKFLERRPHPLRFVLGPAVAELKRLEDGRRLLSLGGRVLVRRQARMPDASLVLLEPEGVNTYQRLGVFAERPGVLVKRRDFRVDPYEKASSLLFLAYAPPAVAGEFFRKHPFERDGVRVWKTRAALDAFLAEVRKRGYAQPPFPDAGAAHAQPMFRLAAPIFDAAQTLIAAVGGFLPDDHPKSTKRRFVRLCLDTAAEIGAGLRSPPPRN
jgi:Transcriptional regulator